MGNRRKKAPQAGKSGARNVPPFAHEFRFKVARLYVEDHHPVRLIASQFGISDYSVYRWGKNYSICGEQGLVDKPKTATGSKLPALVSQSSVDLKKENPGYGAGRSTDILKRFFLVRTSPSTVQRTLREQSLSQPVKHKREKNPAKPRFFLTCQAQSTVATRYYNLPVGWQKHLFDRLLSMTTAAVLPGWGFIATRQPNT